MDNSLVKDLSWDRITKYSKLKPWQYNLLRGINTEPPSWQGEPLARFYREDPTFNLILRGYDG